MKFSIARSELFDSLSIVGRGTSARSTLPILSGVLVSAVEGLVHLQATDLEISVKHSSPALVEDEGQTVIPGRLLVDIVRSLPEAAVVLETEGDNVHIQCQQSSFTVKTLNPDDFPKFPEVSPEKSLTLPVEAVSTMVRQVSRAVSRDETRAILTGVLLVVDGPTVRMVATDSYRLAVRELVLEDPAGEDINVVVPGRALEEVTRLITGSSDLLVGIGENQIVFTFGQTTFITRRIEGAFPNYKQLIPNESGTCAIVSREEATNAVKRVSLLAQHNTPLKVVVGVEDQTLSLSAKTQDIGDASEDLMVAAEGHDVEIAFNHAFLADGLASTDAETIRFEIQSPLKPGVIRVEGDDGFLYLLMPVRLG
jgi:DNA polymerase-3 subunit beta